jgi:hypothetical protein
MASEQNNFNNQIANQRTFAYQLRDIHGLDPVPWWPPALGWWILAAWIIISLWLVRRYLPKLHSQLLAELAWRWDAARQLRKLRLKARNQPTYATAKELSELLRRIAMARYGREICAGLTGHAWLDWLTQHDPAGYAWNDHGKMLLTAPYAPPEQARVNAQQIWELLDATHAWLKRNPHHEEPQHHV